MNATLGLGTYRVRSISEAAKAAVASGADWIDTAPNYHHGQAERQLKPVLDAYPLVPVSTKVGFFTPDQARKALAEGVLTKEEAEAGHCLNPRAVTWQAQQSLAALGRAPAITFVHNPERQLHSRRDLEVRLYEAFVALEKCVDRGLTRGYGVATWNALHENFISVDRIAHIAKQAGRGTSHLTAIQLPLSIVHIRPLVDAGQGYGFLTTAQSMDIDIFASAPLHGGDLLQMIPESVAEEVAPGASPLRVALGFVASTEGVKRLLLSASSAAHWADAAKAVEEPLSDKHMKEIASAFAP
ncbi:aldo/keto reductase [Streptomyces sp. NPDC006134]|uniref:aldo/keto reductase n=1 Tax=Streptomyces sp. NPDC006134 TaxID=3154467 RepID=UPI0033EFFB81